MKLSQSLVFFFCSIIPVSAQSQEEKISNFTMCSSARLLDDRKTIRHDFDFRFVTPFDTPKRVALISLDNNDRMWPQGEGALALRSYVESRPWHVFNTASFPLRLFFVLPNEELREQLVFMGATSTAISRSTELNGSNLYDVITENRISNECKVDLVAFGVTRVTCDSVETSC
ncbi:hypothetical protein [Candidatus Rhodobacter oscarellae]|uniref:hypothetical protein n=1 Tax=Candidatus Rhodobacter oscarellae TaxID=1675527 RepID=UPI00128F928C|nr:hypothetical protein [Candidatus Rhodobacter lobularis]